MVQTRSMARGQKIQTRRSSANAKPIRQQPLKIKARRVTVSGISVQLANETALTATSPIRKRAPTSNSVPKSILKSSVVQTNTKGGGNSVARSVVICESRAPLDKLMLSAYVKMDRLDLAQLTFCKKDPKAVILNNKCCCVPAENQNPNVILNQGIEVYEAVLKNETAKKEAAAQELKATVDVLNEEKHKFRSAANQLDDLQDEWAKLVNINFSLKKRVGMFHMRTVKHDHSYARN